jgi:hypothetical protein
MFVALAHRAPIILSVITFNGAGVGMRALSIFDCPLGPNRHGHS